MAQPQGGYIGRRPDDTSVIVARQQFSPSGATTDFTFASGYTVGYIDAYVNGVKLLEGSEYNATNGSIITVLNGGVGIGSTLEAVAYKAFNLTAASIGIHSSGTVIASKAAALNFIGAGNTLVLNGETVDVSISGAGILEAGSVRYSAPIMAYAKTLSADTSIESDFPTAVVHCDEDLTFDIEEGITLTVDSGCSFNIISP